MQQKIKALFLLASFFLFFPLYSQTEDLLEYAKTSGVTVYWDSISENGIMEKNGHQISFKAGDNFILADFKELIITDSPEVRETQVLVTQKFLDDAENIFQSDKNGKGFSIGAILIDPGHGGKDPGASGTVTVKGKEVTINEKDINLSVGKMLYSRLKKAYPDKKIEMTRSKDEYLSLAQRTDIANAIKLQPNEAILYVSIHVNSSLNKNSYGYEVWYLSPGYRRNVIDKNLVADKDLYKVMNSMMEEEYTTESILIAKFIMDGLQAQIGDLSVNRGIKAEEWFVVRNSNMPAVLVELGFLSNEKEAKLLTEDSYLQKLSLGIYNGLAAFVTHFERSRGFTGIK